MGIETFLLAHNKNGWCNLFIRSQHSIITLSIITINSNWNDRSRPLKRERERERKRKGD